MLLCNISSKRTSMQANKNLCSTTENCHLVTFRILSRNNLTLIYADSSDTFQLLKQCISCYQRCTKTSKTSTWADLYDRTYGLLVQHLKDRECPHHLQMHTIKHLNCTLGKRHWSFFCHNTTGNSTLLAVVHAPHWNMFVSVKDSITLTHTWKSFSSSYNKLSRAGVKDFSCSSSSLSWGFLFSVLDWNFAKVLFFWQGTVALLRLSSPSAFAF